MIEDKSFSRIDYTKTNLVKGEYINCIFTNCNFYNLDLSSFTFNECEFNDCDLSLSRLEGTIFNDIKFINCKLLGLHFKNCNDFFLSVSFDNCMLKLSTFYKLKLKKTRLKACNLQDVDFSESDLTGSSFDNCDLQRAIFIGTNLEKVDFRSSINYSIDPEKNRLKKAKFSRSEVVGLLDKYDIEIE